MLIQLQQYFTFNNIFLWTNLGILPFWLMIILIPNSKFTQFFVNSIIIPLILSTAYLFIIYQASLLNDPFLDIVKLYLSLDNLYTIFSTESFLILFWLHFLTLSLFLGTWISRDGIKYNVSRVFVIISLILVYITGPVGLVFYWIIRIFYSKKLGFHE